jgi:2-polyprenyl-3-methyl-5-hydroxy-6-metoxy-1,4-benzoquinol methylase
MVNQTRVCQGERDLNDRSKKLVTHRLDYNQREEMDYEQGVSVELCPLFDFSVEPWTLLRHLIRQLTLAHLVITYTKVNKKSVQVTVLDVACNYAELWTLLSRQMKAKGARIKYIGVDIDEDKKIIAHQLRSTVDFRVMDMMNIAELPEVPVDVIVCGETIEHVDEVQGREFFRIMSECTKSGGYIILSAPTPESEMHRQNPFHLRLWSLQEIIELGEENGIDCIDGFHLGVHKNSWPSHLHEAESRMPREICRAIASAEIGEDVIGPNFIYVGRKV